MHLKNDGHGFKSPKKPIEYVVYRTVNNRSGLIASFYLILATHGQGYFLTTLQLQLNDLGNFNKKYAIGLPCIELPDGYIGTCSKNRHSRP